MAVIEYAQGLLDVQSNYVTTINRELLSQERWQSIFRCKQEFLQNSIDDPRRLPYMDEEVATSWMRSRKMGVDPDKIVSAPNLSPEHLAKILDKNRLLIDITNTLLASSKDLIISCGYIFYLFDKSGAVLLNEGNWSNFPPSAKSQSRIGILADENNEGTTAHDLCFRLQHPVQLLGPEHYCNAFQNSIATAVPVKGADGKVLAALGLISKPLLHLMGENTIKDLGLHSLGLLIYMAAAIEGQIKMEKVTENLRSADHKAEMFNSQLKTVHAVLETTLASIEESIIEVDLSGNIVHINLAAMRILKLRADQIKNRNIKEFLNNASHLLDTLRKGENVTVEECFGSDKCSYQVHIKPIFDPNTKKPDAAILKIAGMEKTVPQAISKANNAASYTFESILSGNEQFEKNKALARRFAHSPENILIIGESGTGKELYAQAIHNEHCPHGPFMAVNCAAMPRELIESELFGYEGGSFTGAERSGRPGKIELASGGTLFLDEIGDMPLELQAVLLRTLEDKKVMRVGGSKYKSVDFRLVAATNKNLYEMVKAKQFREDLYFRLSVLTVNIPPLRERGEDIKLLSQCFVEHYCQKQGWQPIKISAAAQKKLNEYRWPGNVRQLRNAMIYAVNTAQDYLIKPENLPNYIILETCPIKVNENIEAGKNVNDLLCLENLEKAAIETALAYANNYVPEAAEMLGISRSTLYRKLKDYNIEY